MSTKASCNQVSVRLLWKKLELCCNESPAAINIILKLFAYPVQIIMDLKFNFTNIDIFKEYCKVTSINTSYFGASIRFCRLLIEEKFNVYLLWYFKEILISWLVTHVNARNFTIVATIISLCSNEIFLLDLLTVRDIHCHIFSSPAALNQKPSFLSN